MYKVVFIIFLYMFSSVLYAEDGSPSAENHELPITLNLGLSSYSGSWLGAYLELPLSNQFSASVGLGSHGGFALGAKLYRDISKDGPYAGIGYGAVEVEETYVDEESTWKEDLEYGSFFTVGYRFLLDSGDVFNAGLGLYHRPEENDEYHPEETEGGYMWFTFDLSYGITF
jgi:hypothetical protein